MCACSASVFITCTYKRKCQRYLLSHKMWELARENRRETKKTVYAWHHRVCTRVRCQRRRRRFGGVGKLIKKTQPKQLSNYYIPEHIDIRFVYDDAMTTKYRRIPSRRRRCWRQRRRRFVRKKDTRIFQRHRISRAHVLSIVYLYTQTHTRTLREKWVRLGGGRVHVGRLCALGSLRAAVGDDGTAEATSHMAQPKRGRII